MRWLLVALLLGLTGLITLDWEKTILAVEVAQPTVLKQLAEQIELRQYPGLLVAEVTVEGERGEAASKAFRMLADYIFGNNASETKIEMTAPVLQQPLAPTATEAAKRWQVAFLMPEPYTLDTLPKPQAERIKLRAMEPFQAVVLRFSGEATPDNLAKHLETLQAFTASRQIETAIQPLFAFYNSPMTPPSMRRNEILLPLKEETVAN